MIAVAPDAPVAAPRRPFWRLLTRFDSAQLSPAIALRNTAGVLLALGGGVAMGSGRAGASAAIGALLVAYSDRDDSYRQRARRMLTAAVSVTLAIVIGGLAGRNGSLALGVATAAAFAAGMAVCVSPTAADIGRASAVMVVAYSAQPLTPLRALAAGGLALAGGLLQTGLSLLPRPLRRVAPEGRVLAAVYRELARTVAEPISAREAPPASAQTAAAQQALWSLPPGTWPAAERQRALLDQAERARLVLLAIARFQRQLEREHPLDPDAEGLRRVLRTAADVVRAIADGLAEGAAPAAAPQLAALEEQVAAWRQRHRPIASASPVVRAALARMEALAGQLRTAVDLATSATPSGEAELAQREAQRPRWLRRSDVWATIAANLRWRSTTLRHALRLAACVAVSGTLARGLASPRAYWIPMTVLLVLKPDFAGTFSRGVLRIGGTLCGLGVATLLCDLLPQTATVQLALVAVFVFLLRWLGSGNYGVFAMAVSALIVLLLALTGVAPQEVIRARGIYTLIGGALALIAYAAWPTPERGQAALALAELLGAYRDSFAAVARGLADPLRPQTAVGRRRRQRQRLRSRLARTNLEASVDRLAAEPWTARAETERWRGMLASCNRLAHAVLALDAEKESAEAIPVPPRWSDFAAAVTARLDSLAAGLQGDAQAPELPSLRESYGLLAAAIVAAGTADRPVASSPFPATLVLEADRIVNSIDTLTEQIAQWRAEGAAVIDAPGRPAARRG